MEFQATGRTPNFSRDTDSTSGGDIMDPNGTRTQSVPELIPARMLNEFVYCPRLAYLEWVQGEWEENEFTADGKFQHRRVDQEKGKLSQGKTSEDSDSEDSNTPTLQHSNPSNDPSMDTTIHARSVWLSAPKEGLTAKMDLIEGSGNHVIPVDYKRGEVPDNEDRAWDPDRVQLCAQALVLKENGYSCNRGVLYYIASKTRVDVPIDEFLAIRTQHLVGELRKLASSGEIPPPLQDSPKCVGCSLVGICLPDETNYFAGRAVIASANQTDSESEQEDSELRRLMPPRDDTVPLYVQEQGAIVTKRGELFEVRKGKTRIGSARIFETPQVSIFGNIQVTTQAMREMFNREIPICFFSTGGWFFGMAHGMEHKNVELRIRQFAAAANTSECLNLARSFICAKVANGRTMLMRNHPDLPKRSTEDLKESIRKAGEADSLQSLLGIEGNAAKLYFSHFQGMLKAGGKQQSDPESDSDPWDTEDPATAIDSSQPAFTFDFNGRNRRPPTDPVNALLSYAYSLLVKEITVTAMAVGLDPFLGFFHQPRYGRPALALDLMEEFRPIIADSVVLWAINNGVIKPTNFIWRGPACALKPAARKKFIEAWEHRMDSLVTHPIFSYRISYRRVLNVQTRLLARTLTGEIPEYPAFKTR
jgi:CRISPR-associated protein Cas1